MVRTGLAADHTAPAQGLRAVDAARNADPRMRRAEAADAVRRSRSIEIDLSRLEREGYLVPHLALPLPLATELRIIKQPFLRNARGSAEGGPVRRGNLILVTSAVPGEGRPFAMNLAMSIALEVDHSVLLVDADAEAVGVRALYGLPRGARTAGSSRRSEAAGLGRAPAHQRAQAEPAVRRNAESACRGTSGQRGMDRLLDDLATRYSDRIVVFDAPPLLPTAGLASWRPGPVRC